MIKPHPKLPSCLKVAICLLALAEVASAQAALGPYGESNIFVLNTNRIGFGDSGIVILTSVPASDLLTETALGSAVPNPFNPRTAISFTIASPGRVELGIYDLRGRCLRGLVAEDLGAGVHTHGWDGRTDDGEAASAGVYLVRLASGGSTRLQKITLVK
jgi:hypothetical protein